MKKNNLNKFLNISIIFLFSISIFSYNYKDNTEAIGHKNAGGKIVKVDRCTCSPTGGTGFISVGRNGGMYIDAASTKHYDRGKVNETTKWHISKTTFDTPCLDYCKHGCCPSSPVPSGRLLLFGGTNTGGF